MRNSLQKSLTVFISLALAIILIVAFGFATLQISKYGSDQAASLVNKQLFARPTGIVEEHKYLPRLKVKGILITLNGGNPLTLIGFSHTSLEYNCAGDGHFNLSDFQAMRSWGANTVRITLSSELWFTCPSYRFEVYSAVYNAEVAGLYVILTLQYIAPFDTDLDRIFGGSQYPLPNAQKDVQFWQEISKIYANDSNVIFDLFGESHDVDYATWLNGGPISVTASTTVFPNYKATGTYQGIGMKDLVAKVRTFAPNTLFLVGGYGYGYDLSAVKVTDIQDSNFVYSTHPFNINGKEPVNWDHDFGLLSKKVPIMLSEFGAYDCQTAYIAQLLQYAKAHQMSWLAWAWSTSDCKGPSVLQDWNGTPNVPYGAFIKQQMQFISQFNNKSG